MKQLLTKASKPFGFSSAPQSNSAPSPPTHLSSPAAPHTTGLQPKFVVPAVPHPYPHTHLAILVSKEGLLIRPHVPVPGVDQMEWLPCIRVSWGKSVKVEEIESHQLSEKPNWNEGVVVYGIVGILELFSCSYLLLITSRVKIGNGLFPLNVSSEAFEFDPFLKVLDPLNVIYAARGVVDIPLVEDRARMALKALATRTKSGLMRPSLIPKRKEPFPEFARSSVDLLKHDAEPSKKGSPRVQFSSDLNNLEAGRSILRPSSAQSSSSELSTASDNSVTTSPVFKTLAERLSFWNRLSKRPSALNEQPLVAEPVSLTEEQETFDRLTNGGKEQPAEVIENILASTAPPPATTEERHLQLEAKVVRECIREFTKGGMYFAYSFDITRSLQHKQEMGIKSQKQHSLLAGLGALPSPEYDVSDGKDGKDGRSSPAPITESYPVLPLWRRVDKRFWWNEWMSKPFIDAGLHSFILPIMQGYCQLSQFSIPSDPAFADEDSRVEYIIISRRSRYRPGLRYQRRGIDDEAHVANFVETETIMRVEREGKANIFAYIQIRGSIPLFWTQTGYGLKPPPELSPDRTHAQNLEALKRHFHHTIPSYGPHTIINLAEQHGKEGVITESYREHMHELDMKDVRYHEYDFHTETKGMKYENISNLIESMERTFETQGYFWVCDNVLFSRQKGVFRVNCIDCLDRTNVVQSAFARYVLHKQLGAVALLYQSNARRTDVDLTFNDVWANNGDAISRAYAGTSALKGDFTRTGKRDLSGMLNDGVNSLARMYTSTFSDWFCQAVIDFMLGNRTASVFSEFLLKLKSTDPRDLIRLSRIRAEAIATSVSRVLPEGERLLSGWTLFSPEELNTRIGMKFEEKVLLLSAKAVYVVSYDYSLQKVKLYTRVPLRDIVEISKGAYILSPLEESSRDPEQNGGFVLTWLTWNQESRVTSYSVRNSLDSGSPVPPTPTSPSFGNRRRTSRNAASGLSNVLPSSSGLGTKNFAAFKVLPIDRREMGGVSDQYVELSDEMQSASSCRDAVDLIVDKICGACGQGVSVSEGDVVSLADARRMTSVYAKMEHGVKRLLWLGG